MLAVIIMVIIAALLAVWPRSAHAQPPLLFQNGEHWLRLYDEPCNHAGTLALMKPEWRAKFKKARANISNRDWYACWIMTPEGSAFVLFEDGDQGEFDLENFKPDEGT